VATVSQNCVLDVIVVLLPGFRLPGVLEGSSQGHAGYLNQICAPLKVTAAKHAQILSEGKAAQGGVHQRLHEPLPRLWAPQLNGAEEKEHVGVNGAPHAEPKLCTGRADAIVFYNHLGDDIEEKGTSGGRKTIVRRLAVGVLGAKDKPRVHFYDRDALARGILFYCRQQQSNGLVRQDEGRDVVAFREAKVVGQATNRTG
jgi:hypothetical protein